jgi:hypothetical protein
LSDDRCVRQQLQAADEALYASFRHAEEEIRRLLEYSQGGAHLSYTPHGLSHVAAVERAYDWLLSSDDIRSLNPTECYCLLLATLLHDALMIPRRVGDESRARLTHTTEPAKYLADHGERLGINRHEAHAISEIIRSHHAESLAEIQERTVLGDATVELRKLGACLSVADICHADSSRAPQIVFDYLSFDEESARHWRRHLDIGGVTRPPGTRQLLISALTFSDEGEQAVRDYADEVRAQLVRVHPYFVDQLLPIADVELSVTRQSSPVDRELHFKTDMSAILRILIEGVYERSDVFIRELVQNGLDATYIRAAQAVRRNESFSPRITVTQYLDSGGACRAIRVDDNGVGMDFTQIQDMLLLIGGTSTDSDTVRELLTETTQKNLIATFGVGLLSCLKVASQITIDTKRAGSTPVRLVIGGVDETIQSSEGDEQPSGTTMYVELSEAYRSAIDVGASCQHYFVMVEQADVRVLTLPWSEATAAFSRDTLMASALTEGVRFGRGELDGFAVTDVSGEDYRGWIWFPKASEDGLARATRGDVTILNDGVFVATDAAEDWLPDYLHMCDGLINFSARAVDLPVSRDRVMQNKRLRQKKDELASRCLRVLGVLSRMTGDKRAATPAALLVTAILRDATDEERAVLVRELDDYTVAVVGGRPMTLREVSEVERSCVYVAYPEGRTVKELARFGGKLLYHKEDDIVSLQSSWLSQQGELVLDAKRAEDSALGIREIDVVTCYFADQRLRIVDLTEQRPIEGQERSRPLRRESRNRVGASIKFVEFPGLAASRGWKVGVETWLNLAHPDVALCYEILNNATDGSDTFVATLMVKLVALDFQGALGDVVDKLRASQIDA